MFIFFPEQLPTFAWTPTKASTFPTLTKLSFVRKRITFKSHVTRSCMETASTSRHRLALKKYELFIFTSMV